MTEIRWPQRWQEKAKLVISPYFGRDCRLRIVVDDPATAIDGTVLEGFVYLDGGVPKIIHDRSGPTGCAPGATAGRTRAAGLRTSPASQATRALRPPRLDPSTRPVAARTVMPRTARYKASRQADRVGFRSCR